MSSVINNTLVFARPRNVDSFHGCMGHLLSALASQIRLAGFEMLIAPFTGLAQGRIVSISRGSPPLQEE